VRFAAALCAAKGEPGNVPRSAIDELADSVIDYHPLDAYEGLPYAIANPLTFVAAEALSTLGPQETGYLASRLKDSLTAIPVYALTVLSTNPQPCLKNGLSFSLRRMIGYAIKPAPKATALIAVVVVNTPSMFAP
jgi:hypothetical protein